MERLLVASTLVASLILPQAALGQTGGAGVPQGPPGGGTAAPVTAQQPSAPAPAPNPALSTDPPGAQSPAASAPAAPAQRAPAPAGGSVTLDPAAPALEDETGVPGRAEPIVAPERPSRRVERRPLEARPAAAPDARDRLSIGAVEVVFALIVCAALLLAGLTARRLADRDGGETREARRLLLHG